MGRFLGTREGGGDLLIDIHIQIEAHTTVIILPGDDPWLAITTLVSAGLSKLHPIEITLISAVLDFPTDTVPMRAQGDVALHQSLKSKPQRSIAWPVTPQHLKTPLKVFTSIRRLAALDATKVLFVRRPESLQARLGFS